VRVGRRAAHVTRRARHAGGCDGRAANEPSGGLSAAARRPLDPTPPPENLKNSLDLTALLVNHLLS
jgi:hypothetical protein